MSLFYIPHVQTDLRRYVGLSFVLHVALLLCFWSILQQEIKVIKTTGVGVEIRTMPGARRPAPTPVTGPTPAMPSLPAVRRKIGRIVEKKMQIDMPRVEPKASVRRTRQDDVILMKDKNIAKILKTEQVEMLEVERKPAVKTTAPAPPAGMEASAVPPGEYVPTIPAPPVDVTVEYVEIAFDAPKIDVDDVKWKPAEEPARAAPGAPQPSGDPSAGGGAHPTRRAIKMVKPEAPENLGIQEPKVQVVLRILISENGFVSKAEIERSSGYLELDNRALSAVRQWIYESSARKEARLVGVTYVF